MRRKRFLGGVAALMVIATLLAGCGSVSGTQDSVTITYGQVGACDGGFDGKANIPSQANAAYLVFYVLQIDNSKSAHDFSFDPSQLYIIDHDTNAGADYVTSALPLAQDHSTSILLPTTVQHGFITTFVGNGYGIVLVHTAASDGASEANQTNYFLQYTNSTGFTMVLVKKNASQTAWQDTATCFSIPFETGQPSF